jgi:predicted kinase
MSTPRQPSLPDWSRTPDVPWAIDVARRVLSMGSSHELAPSRRSGLVSGLRVGWWRAGVPVLHRERALELIRWAGRLEGPRECPLVTAAWLDEVLPRKSQEPWCDAQPVRWSTGEVEVEVLSGLPGVGKDTWIRTHRPDWAVVSLDALRETLHLAPGETDERLWQAAASTASDHLRARRPFVWNATNLRRRERHALIQWLGERGAAVTLRSLEVPFDVHRRQNRRRAARVSDASLARMLARWEPPWPNEAPTVVLHEGETVRAIT